MPKSLKHFLRVPRVRNVALATAVAAAGFAHTANAGFLEDFYTSAGASANYTAPQVYQNQAMGVINGGSMVFKAPIRNFTPFTFTPPAINRYSIKLTGTRNAGSRPFVVVERTDVAT